VSVVLITGCSSGIGLETALAFAAGGASVAATMRDPSTSTELCRRAAAEGLEIEVVALDVTDDDSVVGAVDEIDRRLGPIDVLVNNAGVAYIGSVETIDIERARQIHETNFWGAVRTIRAVLPAMRERRGGVIVNVSSLAGRLPGAGYMAFYYSSKHALSAMTESLAVEVGPCGVRVVCVEPGSFATAVTEKGEWAATGSGPYAADESWMRAYYTATGEAGGDSREVAAAILAAVDDETTPLHVPVGEGTAGAVAGASRTAFEDWADATIARIETVSGPRPVSGGPSRGD